MKHEKVAIFFDRDGTINVESGYLTDPDKLELIPGAARAIKEAHASGIRSFIVTNQSGVARGLYTESDVIAVNKRLQSVLLEEGAQIDGVYYCPHHPEYGDPPYRKVCTCRKPKTGMLEQAAASFDIDLRTSFVVGDKCTDMQTGRNAGCGTILVLTGYGTSEVETCKANGTLDHVAKDVYDAWQYIRKKLEHSTNE